MTKVRLVYIVDADQVAPVGAAVAAALATAPASTRIVLPPGTSHRGWSYRVLRDAQASGDLVALRSPAGLEFAAADFEVWAAERVARRRRRKEPSEVVDLHGARVAALERAGLRRRGAS